MFEARQRNDGTIVLVGRLDASHADEVRQLCATFNESTPIDCEQLIYISSAGLGVFIATQRRLVDSGHTLRFRNLNRHIAELFKIAGLNAIFDIE
jgi:anti-sigma B factor antagonist